MKKTTIGLVALAALMASCSNNDVLQENEAPKKAIGFDGFLGNSVSSRAGDDDTFDEFKVWSQEKPSGVANPVTLFNQMIVKKQTSGDGSWTYSPLEYWTKGSSYWFAGLANNSVAKFTPTSAWTEDGAVGTISIEQFAGIYDLVYAYAFVPGSAVVNGYNTPVNMKFYHLLSRFDFRFENDFPDGSTTSFAITDLQINNIPNKATLTLTQAPQPAGTEWDNWVLGTGTRDFLSVSTSGSQIAAQKSVTTPDWNYLIPVKGANYQVTFTLTRNSGARYKHTVTLPNVDLQMGYTYTFVASINAENINPEGVTYPIIFTVETTPWENAGDKNVNFPTNPAE